jgi:hypothetical protein
MLLTGDNRESLKYNLLCRVPRMLGVCGTSYITVDHLRGTVRERRLLKLHEQARWMPHENLDLHAAPLRILLVFLRTLRILV